MIWGSQKCNVRDGPFSQHYHFLHGKSPPNGEFLQIHKRWHDHNEQFFESMLRRKTFRFFFVISLILRKRRHLQIS